MEDVICTGHGAAYALKGTDITYVELDFVCYIGITYLIIVTHVILFLLIT